MKKWIAGLLSIMLLITGTAAALAEEETVTEISWEPYAAAMGEDEAAATYVLLGDTGVAMWIPDVFLIGYVAEEDGETGNDEEAEAAETDEDEEELAEEVIALFGPEDESAVIEVTIPEMEDGVTVDSLMTALKAEDNDIIPPVRINGMDGIYIQDEENQLVFLLVEYEDEQFMKFMFYPIDDENLNAVFEFIIASIQKPEIEEE